MNNHKVTRIVEIITIFNLRKQLMVRKIYLHVTNS
jgi:hypothetical protein